MGNRFDLTQRKRVRALLFALVGVLFTQAAFADSCREEIRRNNILGNAIFTLMFRAFNGEVHDWSDVGESIAYGAGSGYLFYKSRVMIGEGDESMGMATAFLASSVSENVSLGHHPLAYLRYGVGPLELRWATPYSYSHENPISLSLNVIDTLGIATLMLTDGAKDFELRNGVVSATDNGSVPSDYAAYAMGRVVVTRPQYASDQGLWHHELIHTTQYMQYSSFGSTNFDLMNFNVIKGSQYVTRRHRARGINMNVRIEWFNSVMNWLDSRQNYEDRWSEVEAARLAQNTSPLHNHDEESCSAQVGFEFKF